MTRSDEEGRGRDGPLKTSDRGLTAADEGAIRGGMPEHEWIRLTPASSWRVEAESPDRRSVLVFVGTFGRDRSAGRFGCRAEDLPWDPDTVLEVRLVLDRDREVLTFVPDSISSAEFFDKHVESLRRERRLAEIKIGSR